MSIVGIACLNVDERTLMTREEEIHIKRSEQILIVTSYFAINPSEIQGGIGERYVGLYGSFVRKFSAQYRIYWHSRNDRVLREFNHESNVVKLEGCSLPFAILSLTAKSLRTTHYRNPLTLLVAYPYAMHRTVESLISLALLSFLSFFRAVTIIVDDFDPPIEAYVTWNERIPLRLLLPLKTLEIATLKLARLVLFPSESYENYFTKRYKRFACKFQALPNGSFVDLITPKPIGTGELTVLYSGSLYPVKDIPRLIQCVRNLRMRGLKVHLTLTGELGMNLEDEPWVAYRGVERNWLSWVKNILEQADVCVLPYPRRVHWSLTHLAKISDYMAAGKPVISTDLVETSRIFRKYNCGLIAHDWRHFEQLLAELYEHRELAVEIGEAARRAVEEHFDYRKLAVNLEKLISSFPLRRF